MTQPRELTFRGRVLAGGLWLTVDGVTRARALWRPGDTAFAAREGVVLRFASPRAVFTSASWGVPLEFRDGRLLGAPLAPDELPSAPGSAWAVVGGELVDLGPLVPVDLAADVALAPVVDDLVALAPAPAGVAVTVVQDPFAEVVGERAAALELVGAELDGADWRVAALGWMRRLLQGLQGSGEAAPTTRPAAESPRGPGWLTRVDQWLAERMMRTGLGSLVGRAHAAYLQDLIEKLSADRVTVDALRKAIPLGGEGGLAQTLAGLLPGGRDSLDFTGVGGGAGSVVPVSELLLDKLTALYQRVLDRLVAEGRIEEAAYVLAELLGRPMEGVALLEEHEQYRRAAELAEAKDLDSALIVRLWFLAGELERAIDVARRTDSMAAALERLAARDPAQAKGLRVAFAGVLAKAGAFAAAVELLEGHIDEPQRLRALRDAAVQAGGQRGAQHLVRLLAHHPDAFDAHRDRLDAWLRRGDPELREAMADEVGAKGDPAVRDGLARARGRSARRDEAGGRPWAKAGRLRRLVKGPAVTDRPPGAPPEPQRLAGRSPPRFVGIGVGDRGLGPVHDVHRIDDGRWLVARGEDGVELWGPDGMRQRRWELAAHGLVLSDQGLAIAVTERGAVQRLTKLHLSDGKAVAWVDGRFDAFAGRCTDLWFVGSEGRLQAIDLAAPTLRSVYSVDLGGPVEQVVAFERAVVATAGGETWHYELPRIVLRSRGKVDDPTSGHLPGMVLVGPRGVAARVACLGGEAHPVDADGTVQKRPLVPLPVAAAAASGPWRAVAGGDQVVVYDTAPRARLQLEGAQRIGLRFAGDQLLVWDDRGRVLSIGLGVERVVTLRTGA